MANGSGNEASIGNAGTINVSGNVYAGEILFTGGTTIINDGGSGTITLYSSTRGIYGNSNSNYNATINVPIVLGAASVWLNSTGGGGGGGLTIAGGITGASNLTLGLANFPNGAHPLTISGSGVNNTGTITNVNSANGNTTISGPIGGLVTQVIQSGTRPLILSGTNSSYTGTFTVTQGVLQFNSTAAIGGTGQNVTANAGGAVVLNGVSDISALVARVATASTGAIALNTSSSVAIDFNAAGLTAASLGASGSITYSGTLTPAGSTYRLGGAVGTLTLTTSALSGGNSLVVNGTTAGASTVVLSVVNTYTGTTTLNGGTLNLNMAETPGTSGPLGVPAIPANSIVLSGGTLQCSSVNNYDYSSRFSTAASQQYNIDTSGRDVIWDTNLTSSAGSLAKSGNGKLTLNGTNTYTGVTNISGGTLSVATIGNGSVAGNLGQAPSAATNLFFRGGTLQYTGVTASTDRGFSVESDKRATFDITDAATTLTISGGITSGGFTSFMTKTGAGTLVLSGPTIRRIDGSTNNQVDAGTLQFATQVSLENNQTARWTALKVPVASGATVAFNVGGTGEFTTGNVTTLLTNLLGGSASEGLRAGSFIGFDTTTASGGIFTIADNINNNATGGTVGLTKLGTNTLELTSLANTYTGTTTVSAGTLLVNGSNTGSGAVNVSSGATLGGGGSIAGAVNVTGVLSPGASIETLASGALTMNNGSTFAYEVDSSVGLSVAADLQKVTGNLTLTTGTTLTLNDLAIEGLAFAFDAGTTFSLINYTGTWNGGFFTFEGNELANNEEFTSGLNTWRILYGAAEGGSNFPGEYAGGSDSFVNIVAVPEPSAALLGGLALLALLCRRR